MDEFDWVNEMLEAVVEKTKRMLPEREFLFLAKRSAEIWANAAKEAQTNRDVVGVLRPLLFRFPN